MRPGILKGYRDAADDDFVERLEAISTVDVLAPVIHHIPRQPCRILDVGAGTGRDAAWCAGRGHGVVAVEPVDRLRQAGEARHRAPNIAWVEDALPELPHMIATQQRFDVVLLSAVWQHLDDAERGVALATLRALTKDRGKVLLSIRHGSGVQTRPVFPAHVESTITSAKVAGFAVVDRRTASSVQAGNDRAGVTWTWLVLQAQDSWS